MIWVWTWLACQGDPVMDQKQPPVELSEPTTEPASPALETPDLDVGSMEIAPLNPPEGRDFRRLDVDQLKTSFEVVLGAPWSDSSGNDNWEELAESLGRPDYAERVSEDLEPGVLFHKFLTDAASESCSALLSRERTADQEDRIFLIFAGDSEMDPSAVAENMVHLLLRFHGQRHDVDSETVQAWTALYFSAQESATTSRGYPWRTICETLIRHPDFYSY